MTPTPLPPLLLDASTKPQMSDYPAPKHPFFLSYLLCRLGYEFLPKSIQDKAQGIPDLIAEMSEAQDLRDRQVQVAPWEGETGGSVHWWWLHGESLALPCPAPPHRGRCRLPSPGLTQGPMRAQGESQGICPTLGDPMREVLSLQPEREEGWQLPMRLQGQKLGCRGTWWPRARGWDGSDTGDSPVLRPRSPALQGPSSHPSASPAAPGVGE